MYTKLIVAIASAFVGGLAFAQDSCGGPQTRSCFDVRTTPGCSDTTCCGNICAQDGFCCDVEWDYICRQNAVVACNPPHALNDEQSGATTVVAGPFNVSTIGSTNSVDTQMPAGCGGIFGDQIVNDVWYRLVATRNGLASVSSCPNMDSGNYSEFDPTIIVRDANGESLSCNDEMAGCGGYAKVEWAITAGTVYYIQVGGHDEFVGHGRFTLTEEGTVPVPPCPADLTHDGIVAAQDIAALLSSWGTGDADITGDGTVNALDVASLLSAWGNCPR